MSTGTARSSAPGYHVTAAECDPAAVPLYSTCDLSWRRGKTRLTSYIVVLFATLRGRNYLSNLEFRWNEVARTNGRRQERARHIMPLTEWEKAQGMRAPKGAKKQFPVCHLCGREFGTASITIHLKACAEKYEREKGKPAPPAPSLLTELTGGDRPITSADWQAYNEAATEVAQGQMEPCPRCGRTFSDKSRVAVHLRSCQGPKEPKVGSRERGAASPPTKREPVASTSAHAPPVAAPRNAFEMQGPIRGAAPPVMPRPPSSRPLSGRPAGAPAKSSKERMQELKEMLDACLITQDEFDGKRQQILDSL